MQDELRHESERERNRAEETLKTNAEREKEKGAD